ncbi:MAG: prolyl oligopeptidase family serine peptidase [Bacteroidales bacterium]|nr:prolyl oligopeptidase family serine peptidase [Bacteroidales bacterium]
MKRRRIYIPVCVVLVLLAVSGLHPVEVSAQDTGRVMDWKTEYTLRSYLLQEMHAQYDSRRERSGRALESRNALYDYRSECRERYFNLLGESPQPGPLNPVITGRLPLDRVVLEKIIIESRPGHHVTANLYMPADQGPFPAVLFLCGHEMISKATPSYIKAAMLLAENGFAVMVTDPISQGERVQFTDAEGKRILRGSTTEHTLLNAGAVLTGSSVAAWELYDNVRALDYLVSRPEIDSERIGCMGNSGGGAQTMWLISYDDRIKAAAPCSFITSREREYELNGTGDGCQQIPFEGRDQLEIADYLTVFAPKPLLILAGRYDFVDYPGTVDTFNELKLVYSLMGNPEKISLFTGDDGHGLSAPRREAALAWFRKWLGSENREIVPGNGISLSESDTWCTPSGQVNTFFPDEVTVQEHNRRRMTELREERKRFMAENSREEVIRMICRLTSVSPAVSDPVRKEIRSKEKRDGQIIEKLILRRKNEVPMPCIIFSPDGTVTGDTLLIWLSHKGKSSVAGEISGSHVAQAKTRVIAADLRGMGETAEKPEANDPKYYNSEYHNAVLSMHIGQPLPGQRIRDILMIMDYIAGDEELSRLPVKVIASGPAAPSALMAALLDSRIVSLELSATIRSYAEISDRPMEKEWFSYIVPGIMRYFDLPDLAALRPDLKIRYTD